MRYINVDNTVYTDPSGNRFTIKQRRDIPNYSFKSNYQPREDEFLDEIASRESVFGEGGEPQTYKLADYNAEILLENHFDLSRVRNLRVPIE